MSSIDRSKIKAPLVLPEVARHKRSRVIRARAGDHPAIHKLLLAVFHGPSSAEFHALHDEPSYEPTDRLLIMRRTRVLAHVHVTKRVLHFDTLRIPVAGLLHLATLPEHRSKGHATALLEEAERQMAADGAVMGMLRTTIPRFFQRAGWAVCGRHCYSTASARGILSYLEALRASDEKIYVRPRRPLNIRLWRHVEQDALVRLHAENAARRHGTFHRTYAQWRWLISRKAYDRIYVAINGRDNFPLKEAARRIVGYAVTREGRILELITSRRHPSASRELLARICADAMERNDPRISFDGPPDDPLHGVIEAAGGRHCRCEADRDEVFMAKLLDPVGFINLLCPVLHARAVKAAAPERCELGLAMAGRKHCLAFTKRRVELKSGKLGRSYLTLEEGELTQLLTGHLNVAEAVAAGQIEASTQIALDIARKVFPQMPTWHPPLDDLPA